MPPGGGIQSGQYWYTPQEWNTLHPNSGNVGTTPNGTDVIDGKQIVADYLTSLDLSGVSTDDAWNAYTNSGNNPNYLATWVTTTPAFKTIYPEYDEMRPKGYTITDLANWRKQATDLAQKYGVPDGFFTPQKFAELIRNGWDTTELNSVLQDYSYALYHPDVQNRLAASGVADAHTPGGLAVFFTDGPKSQALLDQQFLQAQIGAASDRYGVSVSDATAQALAQGDVTAAAAQTGFQTLGQDKPLLSALPGSGESDISADTAALGVVGGDPAALAALKRRQQGRVAPFQGGGSLTTGPSGFTGAGGAQSV